MNEDPPKIYTEKDVIISEPIIWPENEPWPPPPNVEFTLHSIEKDGEISFMIGRKFKEVKSKSLW